MSSYKVRKTPGDMAWFTNDRFGMFIHWGLYAMPARHEWVKTIEKIPEEKYDKYFKYFDPDMYDPKEWARQAKAAGMKYVVFTTRHHDGFCMFDTKYSDYKCTNTKAGRDLTREYVDAFRAEGLHIGFYYSLLDWHHSEYPIDRYHPRRDDENAEEISKGRDMKKYAQYMRNQLEELMTNYGKIDILWLDFSFENNEEGKEWMAGKGKDEWESEKLIELVRKYQPHIIINNRSQVDQDVWTPEQRQVLEWVTHPQTGELVPWEVCQTFSGSWGYHRDEMTWKSPKMLIEMLINTVAVGGNLLMNVGPTARGYLDARAEAALKVYADWMKYNSRSIYGCTMAEPGFEEPRGCRLTQSEDGSRLYIHLMEYPFKYLEIKNLVGKIDYAQFLHDGSEILYTEGKLEHFNETMSETVIEEQKVYFTLPDVKPNVEVPVIEVMLK